MKNKTTSAVKFCVTDIETGGFNEKSSILTCGLSILDWDLETIIEPIEFKLKTPNPENLYLVDPKALEVNKINLIEHAKTAEMTLEGLVSFISKIKETTDQLFLVGQNIRFDVSFFEEQCPIFLTFFERYHIDISNFAILAKMTGLMPEKNSISLAAQAKYFAIKNENPHSSIEDVRTTVGLLREYKKLFQKQL